MGETKTGWFLAALAAGLAPALLVGVLNAHAQQGLRYAQGGGEHVVDQPQIEFKVLKGGYRPELLGDNITTGPQMNAEERLRKAYEYCLMDFKDIALRSEIRFTDPACNKIAQLWEGSEAQRHYETELVNWRNDRVAREKAMIDQAAAEAK